MLGDMDLLCIHGKHLSGKYVKWAKAKCCDPSGTPGMKATEVCYHKIMCGNCGYMWNSSCVTMKHIAYLNICMYVCMYACMYACNHTVSIQLCVLIYVNLKIN